MTYTNAQAIKEIRSTAKASGLTFKQSKTRLNGGLLWQLTDRKTGEVVMDNYQLSSAYNDCCSGYISSYNSKTGYFDYKQNDNLNF